MAVIQTIRNKFGKIAGALIAIALIGFIVSDARNGQFGSLFGSNDHSVLQVNGTKVDVKEYQQRLKEYEAIFSMMKDTRNIDEATRAELNQQALDFITYDAIVSKMCDKLGITTTEDEKKELLFGQNPDPMIRRFKFNGQPLFMDPDTKAFEPQRVKYVDENAEKIESSGKLREQWTIVKNYVLRTSRINKFNNMFIGSMFTPVYEAKHYLDAEKQFASISYVKIPFTSIADNDIKISEKDLQDYLESHKSFYAVDQPSRDIQYVSFDIKPSSADTFRSFGALQELRAQFDSVKDYETFINKNNTEAPYADVYINKKMLPSVFFDTLAHQPVGSIYGPYYENGSYFLTKVVARKDLADSIKERHILIATRKGDKDAIPDSVAKARVDSIEKAIAAGASFDSLMLKYTDDEGSKKLGGGYQMVLGQRATTAKNFGDFIFEDGKPGEHKIVKDSNANFQGYFYVELQEQKDVQPAMKLAMLSRQLFANDSTEQAILNDANTFVYNNPSAQKFTNAVSKQNLTARTARNIQESNYEIPGIGPSRDLVKWVFSHKVGDVSQVFQIGDQKLIVALLTSVQDKGLPQLTPTLRATVKQKLLEQKKTDLIINKYKSNTALDAIATAANQQVMHADSVSLGDPHMPMAGYEPKVVGYAFYPNFQPNTVSPGIKGEGGVYFITVGNRWTVNADPDEQQRVMQARGKMEMDMRGVIVQLLQKSMVSSARIKYYMDNF
jgi:peptidyl-prolyl cis-trans isomerase D